MSRKSKLLKESDQMVKLTRLGSPKYRAKMKEELQRLIQQMLELGCAPYSLKALDEQTLKAVVAYWRSQDISVATIMNKLSMLRRVYAQAYPDKVLPSNVALNVQWQKKAQDKKPLLDAAQAMKKVQHPVTKTILAFQCHFGLTKQESLRMNLTVIAPQGLRLNRKLAYNGKDRLVPICTAAQRAAIQTRQSLLAKKGALTELADEAVLVALYKADCLIQGLDPATPFRHHYARNRYQSLRQGKPERETLDQLVDELGVAALSSVREMLA